jgi:hypothetical protein
MEIRKFVGKSLSIMKDLKPELRVKGLEDKEVLQDLFDKKVPPCQVKVLGLLWDYVRDVIGFDFDAVEKAESPVTKMNTAFSLRSTGSFDSFFHHRKAASPELLAHGTSMEGKCS